MLKKIMIVAAVCLSARFALANQYGMAGCGLGSVVFKDQSGKVQIFSGILNAIGGQTFAITTGTSNCTDTLSTSQTLDYVEKNQHAIREDISRGQGEALAGLLNLFGCSAQQGAAHQLKENYTGIYGADSATAFDVTNKIKDTLRASEISNSCQFI